MRVAQFIGQSGVISRQKAKLLIDEKRVMVNGKIATHSTKLEEGDMVLVDGKELGKLKNVEVSKQSPSKKNRLNNILQVRQLILLTINPKELFVQPKKLPIIL